MSKETSSDPPAGQPTVILCGLGSHPVLGGLYDQLVRRGRRRAVFLPLENFPQDIRFTFHQVEGEVLGQIGIEGDEPVDFEDLVSVAVDGYFIVSEAEGLSEEDLEYRNTESWAALRALFGCLAERCLVVNHLKEREHFDSRLAELSLLNSHGLPVPKVLVTNSPEGAKRFLQEVGSVVYRTVGGSEVAFRKLESSDLDRLEELKLAPVHFEAEPTGRLAGVVKVGRQLFLNPRDAQFPVEIIENFTELCDQQGLHFAELRLCQSSEGAMWQALGITPFLTEQGMSDADAVDAALRVLEFGEVDV